MMPHSYRPGLLSAGTATVAAMMAGWEQEDRPMDTVVIEMAKSDWADHCERLAWTMDTSTPVMGGLKNVSPYRVQRRRRKNKAARKSRQRNRKR